MGVSANGNLAREIEQGGSGKCEFGQVGSGNWDSGNWDFTEKILCDTPISLNRLVK